MIVRDVEKQVIKYLVPNKVVVILGPRRVGKTILINQVIDNLNQPALKLNGEDASVQELLARRTIQNYKNLLGGYEVLLIDEAQKIPDIGNILKLIVDEIPGIKILVTGSSAFDLVQHMGEPLTGRKKTIYLYPISENEFTQVEDPLQKKENLYHRLIYGNYPELLHIPDQADKADYLNEVVTSYLLKDILSFENIRNSDKILALLRLVAFQIGSTVSNAELGRQLGMSKNTVDRYLDLLTKVFVLHEVSGFSRNLRKEVTKSSKWYFYDNGLRNILIANMNPLSLRNDVGELWENYIISERIKYQQYQRLIVNNYFWRTYDKQELDWVEDRGGQLHSYEMKWSPTKQPRAPKAWRVNYPSSEYQVINRDNYFDWINND
jgi:predicted AAA+ superfamily ATPase